jgi:hypothetical protein
VTTERVRLPRFIRSRRTLVALLGAILVASVAGVSAHVIRGVMNPTFVTAFVSSPSAGTDAPIKIMWGTQDTGLRVVCFYAANTSIPRADDADWPRVMGVGFELPGRLAGFSLVEPLNNEWELVEGRTVAIDDRGTVALDFAIVARVNPAGWFRRGPHDPRGIPPGQPATRGSGTRFCVSGPFPDTLPDLSDPSTTVATTIEAVINGVVVSFHGVEPHGPSRELGLWENPQRFVPLYPE